MKLSSRSYIFAAVFVAVISLCHSQTLPDTTTATTAATTAATTTAPTTATTAAPTTATTAAPTTATTAAPTTATTAAPTTASTAAPTTATTAATTIVTTAATTAATTSATTAATTAATTVETNATTAATEATSVMTAGTTMVTMIVTDETTPMGTMTTGSETGSTTSTTATEPATNSPTPSPVKPPTGTWSVKDDKSNVCMKMQFGARFVIDYNTKSGSVGPKVATAIIDVPRNATPVGKCKKGDKSRKFKLHLFNDGSQDLFHLELTFNNTGSAYKLTEVGSNFTISPLWFNNPDDVGGSFYQSVTKTNFLNNSISLDNTFTCAHTLNFSIVYFTLYDVKLMPYADEAKGDFGKAVECRSPDASGVKTGLIVGIVIAVVAVLVMIAVIVAVKKRRQSNAEDTTPILKP